MTPTVPAPQPDASRFHPAVLVPTYQNASTLDDVLSRIGLLNLPAIVVNDGSTDATAVILERWRSQVPRGATTVIDHRINRGKAAALMTGFAAAHEAGFTHAVTIDADGQLNPEQVPDLLEASRLRPDAYVLGVRDATRPDYPRKSRMGRSLANLLIQLETGRKVSDSQCGLRVYPLDMVLSLHCRTGRFGFETEVIVRAAWAGRPIVEVPVNCRYFSGAERVSHFKPILDTLRQVALHARLLPRVLAPWPHRRV